MRLNTINIKSEYRVVTDCGKGFDVKVITDINPIKKQGLTKYCIEVINNVDVKTLFESTWIGAKSKYKSHNSLREASNYLKQKLKII
jgi:hypothetical protein